MISYAFDFAHGEFKLNGKRCIEISEQELIRNKVEKLLRTEYGRYPIYTDYGMPYYNWAFGEKDREYIKLRLTTELTEKIGGIDGVKSVYDYEFNFENRGAEVSFKIDTIYADADEVSAWLTY